MASTSVVGKLIAKLGLDGSQFGAGLAAAQGRVWRFASKLSGQLAPLGKLPGLSQLHGTLSDLGAMGPAALAKMGAAAAAAMGTMSVSAINSAREIQNMSRVANASPEEFQRMAYGAAQFGIEQQKLSDILKDVNDRVGDFVATGGGPMADFFEKIGPKVGVTAENFRGLSGPQALQLYVDSLEKANVSQQDFTFFMEAMAGDATALLPLLRDGGKMAQEYGDRLSALGGVMDNQTVARLSKMKTALSEVGVVMAGVKNELGAAFAPVIEALAKTFTSLMTKGSGLRLVFDGIAAVVGQVADVFGAVVNIISHVVGGIWELLTAGGAWLNQVTGIGDAITWLWNHTAGFVGGFLIGLSDAITALGGLGGAFGAVADIASEVWGRVRWGLEGIKAAFEAAGYSIAWAFTQGFARILENFASLTQGIADGWNTLMGSLGIESNAQGIGADLAAGVSKQAKAFEDGASGAWAKAAGHFKAASAPLQSLAAVNEKIAAGAEDATGAVDGLGTGLAETGAAAGGGAAKLSEFEKVMKALREEAEKLSATMGMSDLEAAIWEKQKAAGVDALSIQGRQIASTMTQIDGMKKLGEATKAWRDTVKGAFTSFVTGATSFKDMLSQIIGKLGEMMISSGFDAIFNALGGNKASGGFLQMLGIAGARAGGGPVRAGANYLVGERGPEIFSPAQSGVIIPNQAMGGGIQMSASELTLTDDGRIIATVRAEMGSRFAAADRALPARVQQINNQPRLR